MQAFVQFGVAAGARASDEPTLGLLLLLATALGGLWIWRAIGVGEWRPEKDGSFGTYRIDPDRDVEVL